MTKDDFIPLTNEEIEDITRCANIAKVKISGKIIALLERNHYSIIHGGDKVLTVMCDLLTSVDLKHFDVETWYLLRKGYTITDVDRDIITKACKFNG